MENKEEFEIFKGIGADEIEKKAEETLTQEDIDKTQQRLMELVEENEDLIKKSYLKAYSNLSLEDQQKISPDDINKLVNGEKVEGEAIQRLQEMRKRILEEEERELFDKFNQLYNQEMTENQKMFQKMKREFLIALCLGLPGVLFMTAKDLIDKEINKHELKQGIKELAENKNEDKMKQAEKVLALKFGGIYDVSGMLNHIKSSIDVIVTNKDEINKLASYLKEAEKTKKKEIENFLEELETEEVTETVIEEEDEEDDPAPVEGMKIF